MAVRTHQIPVPHPRQGRPGSSRWFALAVLCVSILMVNLDNTVLNVALPTLVRDLQATSSQLQWIVDAYALVFGGLLLVAGSLADRVGRKCTFLVGLVAFASGSAWAAFSGSVGVLIAARASMGVGAALMMPSTLAIITGMFRDAGQRQRAIGFWAGTSGLGFALGPIVGGLLLAHFWWGSVFLINVPIAAANVPCALPLVPDSKNPAAQRPDLAGAVLSIAGLSGGAVVDHRCAGPWLVIRAGDRYGHRRAGGARRFRRMGTCQLPPDAEPAVLPQAELLLHDHRAGPVPSAARDREHHPRLDRRRVGVAARVGGATGHLLAHVARSAFISGADLGLLIAAAVVLAGCVLALLTLPARPRAAADRNQRIRVAHRSARRLCYLRDGQLAAACSSPRLRPAEVNSC